MTGDAVLLTVATVLVGLGALRIFVRDATLDASSRARAVVEAAVPLAGVVVLLWWSWRAL